MNSPYWVKDIDKLCEDIKDEFHWMENRLKEYQERLSNWNKDTEIQAAKATTKHVLEHSLLQLSDKELEAERKFMNAHSHDKRFPTYIYELTGTGIGTCIKIRCPICGAEEDITDTDSW